MKDDDERFWNSMIFKIWATDEELEEIMPVVAVVALIALVVAAIIIIF